MSLNNDLRQGVAGRISVRPRNVGATHAGMITQNLRKIPRYCVTPTQIA
jgi:hypothetical protein